MSIEARIEKARADVKSRVGQHREIAAALDVSYNWVRRFADGTVLEPSAVKFAKLEGWLAKH